MTLLLAIVLVIWSAVNTFLSITAILGGYMNNKEIEVIKSWYPFCDIFKIKIPKKKVGGERREPDKCE